MAEESAPLVLPTLSFQPFTLTFALLLVFVFLPSLGQVNVQCYSNLGGKKFNLYKEKSTSRMRSQGRLISVKKRFLLKNMLAPKMIVGLLSISDMYSELSKIAVVAYSKI